MKRILVLFSVLLLVAAGLYLAQRRHRPDQVSPNALVNASAEWQRDITRVPMRLTRLSDAEEVQIGNELAQAYQQREPALSPEVQKFQVLVERTGACVAAHAHRRLPWRFHVLARPDYINAFALPGGQIFIGLGLLHQLKSEDALAFVLGHEIEHVDHYHSAERVQLQARLNHLDLELIGALVQIPISVWEAGYSKDEEFEADREGLRAAVAAGYSPEGAVQLLARWDQSHRAYVAHGGTPVDELSDLAIHGLTGYFRSHPLPMERLQRVRQVIQQDHVPTRRPLIPLLSDGISWSH